MLRRTARQGRGHNHDGRARHYALRAVHPSPARAEAPEPEVWLPILDITGELEALDLTGELELLTLEEGRLDLDRELSELEADFWRTAPGRLEDAVARVDDAGPDGPAALATPTVSAAATVAVAPAGRASAPRPAPTAPALPAPAVAAVAAPPEAPAPRTYPEPRTRPAPRRADIVARRRAVRLRHRIVGTALVVAILAALAAATPAVLGASAPRRDVMLAIDGRLVEVTTRVETVGALLAEQRIELADADRVVPSTSATLDADRPVRVLRAFPVTVDVDGSATEVRTSYRSVTGLRRQLRLAPDLVLTSEPGRLGRGDAVVFRSPDDVTLAVDGATTPIADTIETDVAALLAARGIALGPGDTVDPALETPLDDGLAITVHRAPPPAAPIVSPASPAAPATSAAPAAARPVAPAPAPAPAPTPAVFQTGSATWYETGPGPGTCAHLNLPMGTIVTITYQGRTAQCRVADRGPQAWTGHIIDLSPDVFRALAPLGTGILRGITLSK